MTVERVTGIEPASRAWKARALPLSYTRQRGSGERTISRSGRTHRHDRPPPNGHGGKVISRSTVTVRSARVRSPGVATCDDRVGSDEGSPGWLWIAVPVPPWRWWHCGTGARGVGISSGWRGRGPGEQGRGWPPGIPRASREAAARRVEHRRLVRQKLLNVVDGPAGAVVAPAGPRWFGHAQLRTRASRSP
jgi:hypothetical protein